MTINPSCYNLRFSGIAGRSAIGLAESVEQQSPVVSKPIGVDEVVFDATSGTFASFQDAPSFTSLLNHRGEACSFVL